MPTIKLTEIENALISFAAGEVSLLDAKRDVEKVTSRVNREWRERIGKCKPSRYAYQAWTADGLAGYKAVKEVISDLLNTKHIKERNA